MSKVKADKQADGQLRRSQPQYPGGMQPLPMNPQLNYGMPMMIPMYMPNLAYFGPPGMMANPFGQSQYSIPQLDEDGREDPGMAGQATPPGPVTRQPNRSLKKPQSKEEYIERFNREVMPELGQARLRKLQAVGHLDCRTSEVGMPGE